MKSTSFSLAVAVGIFCILTPTNGLAQGTILIGFDGPPLQPPGTATLTQQYSESGVLFTAINPFDTFGRCNGTGSLSRPDNGTTYILSNGTDSFKFRFINDSLFSVVSVQLAGFNTIYPDFAVDFIGYRANGTSVTNVFSGSGLGFQTFQFGSEFNSLSRVEVPSFDWSLDNLELNVPEPGTGVLFLIGGVFVLIRATARRQAERS